MKQKRFKSSAVIMFGLAVLATVLLALPSTTHATPPIEISTCTTINAPGHYKLVADPVFAPGPADLPSSNTCITVNASKVDLNLNQWEGLKANEEGYISLPSRTAVTLSQFNEALALVVHELETALGNNAEFIQAIERARV